MHSAVCPDGVLFWHKRQIDKEKKQTDWKFYSSSCHYQLLFVQIKISVNENLLLSFLQYHNGSNDRLFPTRREIFRPEIHHHSRMRPCKRFVYCNNRMLTKHHD